MDLRSADLVSMSLPDPGPMLSLVLQSPAFTLLLSLLLLLLLFRLLALVVLAILISRLSVAAGQRVAVEDAGGLCAAGHLLCLSPAPEGAGRSDSSFRLRGVS